MLGPRRPLSALVSSLPDCLIPVRVLPLPRVRNPSASQPLNNVLCQSPPSPRQYSVTLALAPEAEPNREMSGQAAVPRTSEQPKRRSPGQPHQPMQDHTTQSRLRQCRIPHSHAYLR